MNKYTIMNKYVLITISILTIFFIFHSYKYTQCIMDMNNFRINHKNIDQIDASTLDNEAYPLVMTFIEDDTLEYNVTRYGTYSPLSILKKYENKNCKDFQQYTTHNYPLFYIKSNKDIDITITSKEYIMTDISNVPSVTIKIHPYDILYIPRFSYWKIDGDATIEIYHSHTPISWIISKFYECTYKE